MDYVTDTHSLVWYFTENNRLSRKALATFEQTVTEDQILVPAVVMAEVMFIARKGRINLSFAETMEKIEAVDNFQITPLDANILTIADHLNVDLEMHDLLIVATARYYQASLITKDEQIRMTGLVTTVW